ncbi:MAG: ABC transporter substrate-binding protein [Oscillospiraceae bacterium]|nr:ABC transporter substrate-binding protein [Oscillospiraceae bacterium]
MKRAGFKDAGKRLLSWALTLSLLGSCCAAASADGVADPSQMTTVQEVVEEGMVPVSGESLLDGDYPVRVESSSSMFRIADCRLHVENASMTAVMTMGGTAYRYLWPGTATEADAGSEEDWIEAETDSEGRCVFSFPVAALDTGVPCAAWSRNKELWYDRTLCFRADSLPPEAFREGYLTTAESLGLVDGEYLVEVSLSGGSGRAKIESPARLIVKDGKCVARIRWGSRNYDYMRVGELRFDPLSEEETSAFEIPVAVFNRPMAVVADTVAMSEPHEIEYSLTFDAASVRAAGTPSDRETAGPDAGTAQAAQGAAAAEPERSGQNRQDDSDRPAEPGEMELRYAEKFRVEYLADGSALLTLGGQEQYLLLPQSVEGAAGDPGREELLNSMGLPVIRIPVKHVYAASSSVPDLFLQCGAERALRFSSTAESSWHVSEIRELFEKGSLLYAGKYSAPDYELLLKEGCDLVIENTMILHSPETREKLESLGLPVFLEYSSYEPHPLGRVEWIKLYGLLTGHLREAEEFFRLQQETMSGLKSAEPGRKSVAFFHIASNGAVVVRKDADYVTRMIELAGGESVYRDLPGEENAVSAVTLQMEAFYAQALNADVLIYNSTVSGELRSLEELLTLCPLLKDFKAVRNGDVWCTEQSMFQRSSATAGMIADFHRVLSGDAGDEDLTCLYRLG